MPLSTEEELFIASGAKTGVIMPEERAKQEYEVEAEQAWQDTKDDADADWALTPLRHRETLIYKAQSVARSGVPSEDAFEQRVAQILFAPAPKVAAAAELPKVKAATAGAKDVTDKKDAKGSVKVTKKNGKETK